MSIDIPGNFSFDHYGDDEYNRRPAGYELTPEMRQATQELRDKIGEWLDVVQASPPVATEMIDARLNLPGMDVSEDDNSIEVINASSAEVSGDGLETPIEFKGFKYYPNGTIEGIKLLLDKSAGEFSPDKEQQIVLDFDSRMKLTDDEIEEVEPEDHVDGYVTTILRIKGDGSAYLDMIPRPDEYYDPLLSNLSEINSAKELVLGSLYTLRSPQSSAAA